MKTVILLSVSFQLGANCFHAQSQALDTVFLLKDKNHIVFIDTNQNSRFYDKIADFDFNEMNQDSYDQSLEYLKGQKIKLSKKNTDNCPRRWLPLHQYKGKFYTYHPGDFNTHYKIGITDTSFIDYTGEGPIANRIISFKKMDSITYRFRLVGIQDTLRSVIIHIIDKRTGIAVFENTTPWGTSYRLMVSEEKMRIFPIIVNYAERSKPQEFKGFEEIDYQKLLPKKNNAWP